MLVKSAARLEAKRTYADALGKSEEADRPAGPRPVLIEFHSAEDKLTVLRARRKLQGTTWGLEEDLTPLQQSKKSAAWPAFMAARKAGRKATWRAERLFIEGAEHKP